MFGFENGSYGIWDILKDQVVATKDVIFDESVLPARKDNMDISHLSNVLDWSHEECKSSGPSIDIDLEHESSVERSADGSVRG